MGKLLKQIKVQKHKIKHNKPVYHYKRQEQIMHYHNTYFKS